MHRPRPRTTLTAALLIALAVPVTSAAADGLPVVNLDTTRTGIEDPSSGTSYFALPDGSRRPATQVLRVADEPDASGESLETTELRGNLAVPGVAWDGTTSGFAADGDRLVLIEPRIAFPRDRTRLVVVDTDRMKKVETIDLEGDFSFDAVSPDGSRIYLIHYFDRRDPSAYEVRAWDVERGRLFAEPIIDRRIAPRVMRGYPMTRATSPDGSWAYTLYDGARGMPFVHALNTAEGTALCIDLPMLDGGNVNGFGLAPAPDGERIAVLNRRGDPVASIATSDWSATETDLVADADAAGGAGGAPLAQIAGLALALGGLAAIAAALWSRRRRGRRIAAGSGSEDGPATMPPDPFAAEGVPDPAPAQLAAEGDEGMQEAAQERRGRPAGPPSP